MSETIIILGSSRSKGDTYKLAHYLQRELRADLLDLKTKHIGYFDYDFVNETDDFLPLIRRIATQYHTIVFATPVYWYSMSAQMKTFFDRISDLLKIDKPTGRLLRGKNMAVLSCSGDDELVEGFYMPFIESARYLGMGYLGHVHGWLEQDRIPEEVRLKLKQFSTTITNNLKQK